MLPRQNRLATDKDFARLFKSGRFFDGPGIGLKAVAAGPGVLRLGFAVGVKVAKRAVARNLIKRRLREIVRKRLPSMRTGCHLVFIAKPGAADLEFADLEKAVDILLKKSGVIART